MSPSYTALLEQLRAVRRRWRWSQALFGAAWTLAAAGAVLILAVALDNLLRVGPAVRWALGAGVWALLLWALWQLAIRGYNASRPDDFFAVLAERRFPGLKNVLINALQLGRPGGYGSPRIVSAIVDDAGRAVQEMEIADCVDWRPARRAALAVGGVGLAMACYAAFMSVWFLNGAGRILAPGADIPPYSATQIIEDTVKPGNVRVPEGATLTLEARVRGILPARGRWCRSTPDGGWRIEEVKADSTAPERFATIIPGAESSFAYYLTAGDGRSRQYRVEVVKRPRVEGLNVQYRLPEYAGGTRKEKPTAEGEIAGVAGTEVILQLKASKALRSAQLVTDDPAAGPLALSRGADDRTWQLTFTLWSRTVSSNAPEPAVRIVAPARYRFIMLDGDGYETTDPLWRTISLERDQNPGVIISEPGRDLQLTPESVTNVTIDAADDYGIGDVRLLVRVNDDPVPRLLARFAHDGAPECKTRDTFRWTLADSGLKDGDVAHYWAAVTDRNTITGPGRAESRQFTIYILRARDQAQKAAAQMDNYVEMLEEVLKHQRQNRSEMASGMAFSPLAERQTLIRTLTGKLARAIEKNAAPMPTVVTALDEVAAGPMAEAVRLLETGRDATDQTLAADVRARSLPVHDRIIATLEELLLRLQKNEQARNALRKLAKTDSAGHKAVTETLNTLVKDLNRMEVEKLQLVDKLEKLPKHPVDEANAASNEALKALEDFQKKWAEWAKGKIDDLTKLPTGFVDDFGLRKDARKIVEEVEKAASRPKAVKMDVAVEDMAVALATKMKEDLEVWLVDTPDYVRWSMEEPLNNKPIAVPEMPLPAELEDMVGDLLQQADEMDKDAEDMTSSWGDNMDQAGWGVVDGPISIFSGKGKTGNDVPNAHEATGRSGDGRRGKSSGQMIGDSSRGLSGRKTPARVGAERYEPGAVKQTGRSDPEGATGGGKKTGAGEKGLQGGTPPDFVKNMGRLGSKMAGMREKAEKLAQGLAATGIVNPRLNGSIQLMKSLEGDVRDRRYEDAARKRPVTLGELQTALTDMEGTAVYLSRAQDVPAEMREELVHAASERYPEGYEPMLKSYFRALSESEQQE